MKQVFLFVSIFIVNHSMLAQVGIKASGGINFSDFKKDPSNGHYKSRVGYQAGASLAIGNTFYIEPGFYYITESNYITNDSTHRNIKFDTSGWRMHIAMGVNLWGKQRHAIGFRFFGGPSAFIPAHTKNLSTDDIHWALFAGMGIDISFFFLEASYQWSMTNIQNKVSEVEVGERRSFFINAGFRIKL